ncbi:MAG: hypothetical protein ACAH65_05690 [Chloroflexota bacterium]
MRFLAGLVRIVLRWGVMLLVMAVAVGIAVVAGLPGPLTLALAIALPGLTGLFWVGRRRQGAFASARRAAGAATAAIRGVGAGDATRRGTVPDLETAFNDPEASMPRWRRPSLMQARKLDPSRTAEARHDPIRFPTGSVADRSELRMVRYAVVPLLDWPDEVLGERQDDLATGDEVRVIGVRGAFLEIECPDGRRGWIHRTTVGPPAEPHAEAQEALDAVLLARGLR